MKISAHQKAVLLHAAYSAAATALAGGIGWVAAHGANLVGKRYEFYIAGALIPVLEYARKWFTARELETKAAVVIPVPPASPTPVAPAPAAPVPGDTPPAV